MCIGNNSRYNCRECRDFEKDWKKIDKDWEEVFCQKCGIKSTRFFMDEFANGKIVCKDQIYCQIRCQSL